MKSKTVSVLIAGITSLLLAGCPPVGGGATEDQVSSPTFSPAASSYSSDQSVTISCATSGASIHYTTDGSRPTDSSTLYSLAIPVADNGTNQTINAIAVKAGRTDSNVASAT
jgi:hypothetical protein